MIKLSFLFQSIFIGYKGFDILFLKVVENFDFICKYSMRDVESSIIVWDNNNFWNFKKSYYISFIFWIGK